MWELNVYDFAFKLLWLYGFNDHWNNKLFQNYYYYYLMTIIDKTRN